MHLMNNRSSSLLSSMVDATLASSLPSYEKESKSRIRLRMEGSPQKPSNSLRLVSNRDYLGEFEHIVLLAVWVTKLTALPFGGRLNRAR